MAEYSPMMQHYLDTKNKYKDCILFYRLGDFYEMFFDDAITTSRELELTLTGKDCGKEERAPMCGIPFHAAENYIAKLIAKGYKVAICEQLEDPKQSKGIVKRDVIRVVTPGTVMESNLLEEKKNNYIMSIFKTGIFFGIAVCDISTGDFYASEIKATNNFAKLLDEISRYSPAEIIVNDMMHSCTNEINKIKERFDVYISKVDESYFVDETEKLQMEYTILDDKECQLVDNDIKDNIAILSINALITYLKETQKTKLDHINKIIIYRTTKYMALDINARRNLELTEKMRDKSKKGTLLWVLDKTSTSMGGRLLRRWINDPLVDVNEINLRLEAVKELKEDIILRGDSIEYLKKVYDIERLAAKIAYGTANGRDLISLKNSAKQLPEIKNILNKANSKLLKDLKEELDTMEDIYEIIDKAIVDEPPISVKEGDLIKLGYDEEIDKLKTATMEGKNWIIELEAKEREKTGIKGLKVGFNKVFGYFIEVTKSNLSQVPDRFIRKQTLANCERYITEDLKNLENQILGAEEKVINLEYEAFSKIRKIIEEQIQRLQKSAAVISTLDVLCSFATVAEDFNYTMPIVNEEGVIDIKDGRHPVIEKMLPTGSFVGNDTYLDEESNRLAIITGPNMAGKSTYMRQVALIVLMAQIGCFVPASYAKIGVVDKIFTRVGASDDLSMGQSTFMVEMMEVASILKEATKNSLVILDEIGRGTSTYDGLSIAWAVAEHIADIEKCGAKTLFATHYHELTDLENKLDGVKNYSIAVKEKGEDIIFLRKIVKGGTDESYGVHVARLAGVPQNVTKRANEILRSLEKKSITRDKTQEKEDKKQVSGQFDMFNYKIAEIAHEIDKIDLNRINSNRSTKYVNENKRKNELEEWRLLYMQIMYKEHIIDVKKGTKVIELLKNEVAKSRKKIIACRFNNEVKSLNHEINSDGKIELIDISNKDGMRIYRRGLIYIIDKAFHEIYPEAMLTINYQLSNSMLCEVSNMKVTKEMIEKIDKKVKEIINRDAPITKVSMTVEEAEKFYNKNNTIRGKLQLDAKNKKEIMLYYCEDYYNYFYGVMPISTGILDIYEIDEYDGRFLIRYPSKKAPDRLPEFKENKKLLATLDDYEDVHKTLNVHTLFRLNKIVTDGKIKDYILLDEALHEKKMAQIADDIVKREKVKVILIAGPSSSGKTTFAKRLGLQLRLNGLKPVTISVDNYFVERSENPKDEFGNYDFECLEAIDVELFNEHILKLLNGEEIEVPTFDFEHGTKLYKGNTMKLNDDQVLVIEGIHCLNDKLTPLIPKEQKYKVYISALTVLNIDEYNRISTTDTRLIRRIVRDNQFRSYSALHTLKMWDSVNRGEERNIFPYQEEADSMFNSSFIYELGVLKDYAMPLLEKIDKSNPEFSEAKRLYRMLGYFESIKEDYVPKNSLLREFIGGSIFED